MIWNRQQTNNRDWRKVLAAVLLIAAMFRSLIPAGFMPAAAAGSFEIVICSSSGLKTVSANQHKLIERPQALTTINW